MIYRYSMSQSLPWKSFVARNGLIKLAHTSNSEYTFGMHASAQTLEDFETSKLTMFPRIPEWFVANEMLLLGCKSLPDVFSLGPSFFVSSAMRDVIECLDPKFHQFSPVKFYDKKGKLVDFGEYFKLSIRRVLLPDKIEFEAKISVKGSYDFRPEPGDAVFLSLIEKRPDLKQQFLRFPIWVCGNGRFRQFFINDDLLHESLSRDLSGLVEYSAKYGKRKETLGHI